jgi:hypothetical protein
MARPDKVIVKNYKGRSQAAAMSAYQSDAARLASQGYVPVSQSWAPGTYGCASFLVALLLCLLIIGILIFIYMLIVKPPGVLTVTYELRSVSTGILKPLPGDEKVCPRCAEHVKAAAKVCRFCGHEFS